MSIDALDEQAIIWSKVKSLKLSTKGTADLLGISVGAAGKKLRGVIRWTLDDVKKINSALSPSDQLRLVNGLPTALPPVAESVFRGDSGVRNVPEGFITTPGNNLAPKDKSEIARRRFKVWVLRFEQDEPWAIPRIARELGFSIGSINGDIRAIKNGYNPVPVLLGRGIAPDAVRTELGELNSSNAKTSLFEFNEMPRAVAQ